MKKKPQTVIKTIIIPKGYVAAYSFVEEGKLKIIFEDDKSFWRTPKSIKYN